MPTLHHHDPTVASDAEVTVFVSSLRPTDARTFLRLLMAVPRTRRHLARADGLVGYSLVAQLRSRTLWTISAWRRPDDLAAFTRSGAHGDVMRSLRGRVGEPAFRRTTTAAGAVPYRVEQAARVLS